MAKITQMNREIKLKTPLGDDVLLLHSMSGHEELGTLFEYQLELVSDTTDADFNQLIGDTITVSLEVGVGRARYFNGYVNRFAQTGTSGHTANYRATVVPWFWFLTQTSDCRIFQNMTVPDIIKDVFREAGYTDFEDTLSGSYRSWVNCVQYRENDFNFINRLMEQEGIYYFFKHEEDKHTLVLADSYSSHEPVEGYEEVSYHPPGDSLVIEDEHLYAWEVTQQLQPGAFVHKDFDFTAPKKDLLAQSNKKRDHAKADLEIYDYPGEYKEFSDGDQYSRVRLEEMQARHLRGSGKGDARGLTVGGLFKLTDHPREDQNIEYLIVSASYELSAGDYGSGGGGGDKVYTCDINVINAQEPFRPLRVTPRPLVQGPQTAIVVGPAGEEIWTDKFGRVKVQFHWDRYGENNENSSCWMRVSYPWAGKNWGAVAIPRIGQEVIVSFIEGDPDRPIITGRVYNDDNMPPYDLPENATQSGVKTRSSMSGTGEHFNELRFEDKKGSEEIYIHAEKDQNNIVENDETTTIGRNRKERVGNNETVAIGSSRSVTIGKNKNETVAINKAETIGAAKELTIGGAYQVSVGAVMNETVLGAKMEEVGAYRLEAVAAYKKTTVGEDFTVTVDEKYAMEGKKEIAITSGSSSVTMNKDGKIEITGTDVTFKTAAGKIHIDAGGIITIKGSMVKINT